MTGAAQKRLRVNTPATAVPGARRMTSRSLRPGFLTPAIADAELDAGDGMEGVRDLEEGD